MMEFAPPAIELRGVNKRYRLYHKPLFRFLDLFGLCPSDASHYTEHLALDAIDLSVWPSEKVAIIGRNGAGKSTLLKIITSVLSPTSGDVTVRGTVSNLLQLGSGFHPDFTGRQNVYANLAHQGVTGRAADKLFEEIVEFAEIGEYIDQPMKTYSTGMCSRLMFSSAIVVQPQILVVDEILGVGDAYFSHKSFERMRQLCSRQGTTLLLVTHDLYSALSLCDRFIWIDRGRIRFDGEGKAALALYESSIKEQEEHWLRQRNASLLARDQGPELIHVLVRTRTGFAVSSPVALETLELQFASGGSSTLVLADGAPGWDLLPEGNLDAPEVVDRRRCRALKVKGSIYHKAEWLVRLPPGSTICAVRVRSCYRGEEPIDIRVFTPDRELIAAGELLPSDDWSEQRFEATKSRRELDLQQQTDYGTGLVRINAIEFLDANGSSVVQVRHGDPLIVRVHCRKTAPIPDNAVTIGIGFAKQGSPYIGVVADHAVPLPQDEHEFTVDVMIESVWLGSGPWFVALGVGEVNLYKRKTMSYFTVDEAWYHFWATRMQLQVLSSSHLDATGVFVVHPATIRVIAPEHVEATRT